MVGILRNNKDLSDMCMQLSTDIKAMVAIVIGTKKTKLHELRTNSTGLSCDNFEPVKSFNQYAPSTKGPTQQVSPSHSTRKNMERSSRKVHHPNNRQN